MPRSSAATSPRDAVLFAPVGGNSGLVPMVAWELAKRRKLRVVEWHLIVLPAGAKYMDDETLAPGAALDELHLLDATLLPRDGLHRTTFRDVHADADQPSAARESHYLDAVLAAAGAAVAAAGSRPVVFALVGGRDRVMTVAATLTAQLLARPEDLIVDLRVTPKKAVERGGYVLPDRTTGRYCDASVRVDLVDVPIPRLRGLLPLEPAHGYRELIRRSQQLIDAAAPVRLDLDLRDERAKDFIAGIEVEFTPAMKLVLASLALVMETESGSTRWPTLPNQEGHPFREVVRRVPWATYVPTAAVARFVGDSPNDNPKKLKVVNGKVPALTRGFTDVARRLNERLAELCVEHPDLPRIEVESKKAGGSDPHFRVRLVGLVTRIIWPEARPSAAAQRGSAAPRCTR